MSYNMNVPVTLACKLASIAVHADELMSADGHVYDRVALRQLLADLEVKAWLDSLGPLLPQKRKP